MRKLAVVLALATTALSTPALARDDAWYVGVEAARWSLKTSAMISARYGDDTERR